MTARINRSSTPANGPEIARPIGTLTLPPSIDLALLDYLTQAFAVRLSPSFTERDYDRMLGHQQVIEHLKSIYDQQDGG